MQKPNLDRLWRVWIKILPQDGIDGDFKGAVSTIKSQVTEVVSILETNKVIDWYYFLIHGKDNDPHNLYFDVVFSVKAEVEPEEFLKLTPSYCLEPKHLDRAFGESICGINKELLNNEEIEEVWRIIGEQSEWIIHMVNIHKDNELTIQQFIQLMHFFMNTMGLGNLSRFQIIPPYVFG